MLESFILKTCIQDDFEFDYLKWLLNNINHVKKLEIHLYKDEILGAHQTIWNSLVNANFIRLHCLPDQIINMKYFSFYIRVKCQLLLNDIDKIRNSFQTDNFFISHQWANVKCFYNEKQSNQHIFSSNFNKFQFFDLLM